jgi:glycosyltransferase involved in cell wall biosynthesis
MNSKKGSGSGQRAFNNSDMNEIFSPLVSIITPFFNGERYLLETIESVIQQKYTNWELILIDDGSSDNSTRVAQSYSQKFAGKIFYIQHDNHENKGASASRNLGISKSRGELLAFLDSDDVWLPEKLQRQVDLLKENPQATVVCEATKYWNSWSDPQKKDIQVKVGVEEDKLYYPTALASKLYPLGSGPGFCNCALIVKKELLNKFGGFDENFVGKNQLYEDQVLFVKLYLHATVYISSLCNNFYRQRPDSLMHGLYAEGYSLKGKYFFLQWLENYIKQNNIANKNIQRSLKKALMPYRHPFLHKISRKIESAFKKLMPINIRL